MEQLKDLKNRIDKNISLNNLKIDKTNQTMIRGLSLFIGDIRNSQNREQQDRVVMLEMAKIRQRFVKGGLSAYDRKKYVWKLIYSHILGYDVDFGHDVAITLINSPGFSEKCTGYIAIGIMLNEKSDFHIFYNCLETMKRDLSSGNEVCQALVLGTVGNIGSPELCKELLPGILHLAFSSDRKNSVYVQKKASVCLLSCLRRCPEIYNFTDWSSGLQNLLQNTNYGLLLSASHLMYGTIRIKGPDGFVPHLNKLIDILQDINGNATDYYYYLTPSPWLQVRIFKIFKEFPVSLLDKQIVMGMIAQISRIYKYVKMTDHVSKNNADHAILFEAIALTIHLGQNIPQDLRQETVQILSGFVKADQINIRSLGLEYIARLGQTQLATSPDFMKDNLSTFLQILKQKDVTLRKKTLDCIFSLCNQEVAGEVVNELLDHMQEGNDFEIMEEMVLKVAILAEKFAQNLMWYIDVIIKLIEYAGDYVDEDLWFRVAQMITGFGDADTQQDEQLQKYAAIKMYDVMKVPSLHEAMVKVGSYVLSEFGYLIADQPNKDYKSQFQLLKSKIGNASENTKAIIMTSMIKMTRHSDDIKSEVTEVMEEHKDHWNVEIQQRACEYLKMLELCGGASALDIGSGSGENDALIKAALDKIPNFSEEIQNNNVLTKRILALKAKGGLKISSKEDQKKVQSEMMKAAKLEGQAEQPNLMEKHEQPSAAKTVDLLDTGAPQQQTGGLDDLFGGPVTSAGPLKFQSTHPADFAPSQTIKLPAENPLTSKNCDNFGQWKTLLPVNMKEGILYSDSDVEVTVQLQQIKYLVRSMLTFNAKSAGIQNVEISLANTTHEIDIQSSPVRINGGSAQAVIMTMFKNPIASCPEAQVNISLTNMVSKSLNLRLPIFANLVIESVDQMNQEAFAKNWDQITNKTPDTFHKIDLILKNPAPAHIPVAQVLQNIENFFKSSYGVSIISGPSNGSQNKVQAAGQFMFKQESQTTFPSGVQDMKPSVNTPIMLEAEFYPEDTTEFRLSVRAPPKDNIATSLIHLLKLFMYPN